MNIKRALWMAVLVYVVSFVLGLVVAQLTGFDPFSGDPIPDLHWYISFGLTLVVIGAFSLWYFRKATPTSKNGLYLGLIFVGVGFLIDFIIIVPVLLNSATAVDIGAYYADWRFWTTIVLIVVATTLVGMWKEKK